MSTPRVPDGKPSDRISIPGWLARILSFFTWFVVIPLAHCGIPWAMSLLTTRFGWTDGHPGIWNLLGLIPVVIAGVVLVWIFVTGIAQTPERVRLGLIPPFLLVRGPYAFTRNPMYVGELGLWLGWSIFYGSVIVLIGFVVLCIVINFVALPREERTLEAQFGDDYLQYRRTVPRWLGKTRH